MMRYDDDDDDDSTYCVVILRRPWPADEIVTKLTSRSNNEIITKILIHNIIVEIWKYIIKLLFSKHNFGLEGCILRGINSMMTM